MTHLDIRNLAVHAGESVILSGITASFFPGTVSVIVGKNGSGKSTLAQALAGRAGLSVSGTAMLSSTELLGLPPEKRATAGLFVAFQSPVTLPGITVLELLARARPDERLADIRKHAGSLANGLCLDASLLDRPLEASLSGGERKKLEILQAAMLDPRVAILDEVDSGVDTESLKGISAFLNQWKHDRAVILITHRPGMALSMNPDQVLVMEDGRIARQGGIELLECVRMHGESGEEEA